MTVSGSIQTALTISLDDCDISHVPIVGGKNASLGEMIQHLTPKGISIPSGFATTAFAFRNFMKSTGLNDKVREILKGLDTSDLAMLRDVGARCRRAILSRPFPKELQDEIEKNYRGMCERYGKTECDVAVRSSATAEDLPNASFAGQQETFLNVHGVDEVISACHRCFASLFTDRAICYRVQMGFDHNQVALSVGVQLMVRSDLASSGVMFSIDTESGFKNAVLINGAYGLGENVVQGAVNPDEFLVFKPTLMTASNTILEKRLGSKEIKMIYDVGGSKQVKNIPVAVGDRRRFCLSEEQILKLAKWACIIEDHYSQRHGKYCPMDMEWALDGQTNQLFIVQARPETIQSQRTLTQNSTLTTFTLKNGAIPLKIVAKGSSVGSTIGQGVARVIKNVEDIKLFKDGEILVTTKTDPDWEPIMKKACGIITNLGGRTCHAAILSRELGLPAVVGCGTATESIKTGDKITLSCSSGENGLVYAGLVPFEKTEVDIGKLPNTKTKILMNVGNPQDAFRLSSIPCAGVGLARLEFIIANHVQIHPLALTRFDNLKNLSEQAQIGEMTYAFPNKPDYFVEHLASGIALIAAAFYPRPVIVRMSDFKSNEYANLLGGSQFEPNEENPMIGWRGASRYYHEEYREGFALECKAFLKVRNTMGLTNVIPMIPFCRTPEEGVKVVKEMANNGLVKGENGLEIYVMCEIPSNVLLADEFLDVFDGMSIGSNDLTQLTLGLDRDSEIVANLFDERSGAVKKLISSVIQSCKRRSKKIGICGQAPSDYPLFCKFLVEEGINSISLNHDSVISTILKIPEYEK